jgi:hypothetical protein
MMRNILIVAAGAAALAIASPAAAQVHVHTNTPGVGVHVDTGGNYYRRHHRGWRARAECRQVTTRTVRPNGTVVVKKRTRC